MTAPESAADEARPIKGDLTRGPILRTLALFAVPMLISNLIQTLNGTINAIWVGRLLGESALAATTNANGVMFLLFAAVIGLGTATTVRVGQHFGARDMEAARRTFGSGLGFSALIAMAVGLTGWFVAPALLHLLGTPQASFAQADIYLRVIFVTMPFGAISMVLSMALRGVGDARLPLHAMILTVVLDIVFNPLLIIGVGPFPELGIAGSALSTALANMAGVAWMIAGMARRGSPLRLSPRDMRLLLPEPAEMRYIVGKGVPMGLQMLMVSSAQMIVIGLANREGVDTTAAYGAAMNLWGYLQMPAFAISGAVSAMVAQNIGAGSHGRVSEVTNAGMLVNVAMTGTLAAAMVLFDRPLLALFLGADSPAVPIAQHIQYISTWPYVLMGASMIVVGTMRSYGVVMVPLLIQATALYPVRLGFYFTAYPHIGSDALWWSFPLSSVTAVSLSWLYYTRGPWRQRRESAYARRPESAA